MFEERIDPPDDPEETKKHLTTTLMNTRTQTYE